MIYDFPLRWSKEIWKKGEWERKKINNNEIKTERDSEIEENL